MASGAEDDLTAPIRHQGEQIVGGDIAQPDAPKKNLTFKALIRRIHILKGSNLKPALTSCENHPNIPLT